MARVRFWLSLVIVGLLSVVGVSLVRERAGPQQLPQPDDPVAAITAACRQHARVTPVVRQVGGTLHIYLPLEDDLVGLDRFGSVAQFVLGGLQKRLYYAGETSGQYDAVARQFHLVSQTVNEVGVRDDPSIKLHPSVIRALYAIHKALLNTRRPIEFFSLTSADIRTGDEFVYTCYLPDLRSAMRGLISDSEFAKRVIRQATKSQAAIGDRTGAHLDWEEIYFPQFLAVQIGERVWIDLNEWRRGRIADEEMAPYIVWTAATVLAGYGFRDYETVSVQHVPTQQEAVFPRVTLEAWASQHLDWEAWWRALPSRVRHQFHAPAPAYPEPAFHQVPQRPGI